MWSRAVQLHRLRRFNRSLSSEKAPHFSPDERKPHAHRSFDNDLEGVRSLGAACCNESLRSRSHRWIPSIETLRRVTADGDTGMEGWEDWGGSFLGWAADFPLDSILFFL